MCSDIPGFSQLFIVGQNTFLTDLMSKKLKLSFPSMSISNKHFDNSVKYNVVFKNKTTNKNVLNFVSEIYNFLIKHPLQEKEQKQTNTYIYIYYNT
jgi:hypothetical protein